MGNAEPGVGDVLGRYRLVEVLGRGGMGTVFRARDDELERDVAVKVINPALAGDPEFRERFRREAVVLSQMDSAHVVAVHDHGEQDGAPYLVTQLVRGGDLFELLRDGGALEPGYAVDLALQVLEGLADAHAIGVVHRDVKPSNVLLREDRRVAYLCDFGIASSPGGQLTRTGVLVGSTAYMAPERHSADTAASAGVAADVYAVGCLLWHLLTGTQPFVGTDAEVAMGHLRGPVPQLPGREPGVVRLNAVLRRAMAKDRKQRYASARAMAADLRDAAAAVPAGLVLPEVTAVRQAIDVRPARGNGRRRVLATLAVVVLVASGGYVGARLGGVEMAPSLLASDDTTTSTSPTVTPTPSERTGPAPRAGGSASPRTLDGGGLAADGGDGAGAGPGASPRSEPTSGPTSRPTRRPEPSPSASPRPVASYRCWDGRTAARLADCSLPTGWAGARWVFPGAGSAPGCEPMSRDTPGFIEGWGCSVVTRDGSRKSVTFIRWRTPEAATTYFWGRYRDGAHRDAWVLGGDAYGRRMGGRSKPNGYFHSSRVYAAAGTNAWSMSAQGNTDAKRDSMFGLVRFRSPAAFRGTRTS